MDKHFPEKNKAIIILISAILILVGVWMLFRGSQINNPPIESPVTLDEILTPTKIGYALPESAPVRLRIPSIYIDAPFTNLGLSPDGEIEIPKGYQEVGWYINGPTPGELGPAVVLGHVDSYTGPAVFFSLGQLKLGDLIEVERQDGKVAVFGVDKLERYSRNDFPTALVYGDLDYAGLRLITCSGVYDKETNEYNLNLVVYASLVEVE